MPPSTLTPEQFIAGYAKRSNVTVEQLLDFDQVVVPCECDYELCEGWALVSREAAIEDYGGWVYPPAKARPANEVWYQKPWSSR